MSGDLARETAYARRRVVMARSQKLGHCICNPLHPCPCPPLINQNVCPCAGERLPQKRAEVFLTRHVRRAGCASKIGQADLAGILSALPAVRDPNVLLGAAAGDDAGVYKLDDRHALVQTVDVFTPCVDDAYLFGQIAAANSLSDVYAMGGRPLTALSIVGFPIDELDGSILTDMLRGGMEKLEEAGCALIGGHSINDDEIKCGFAVTGLIDIARTVPRDRARPGDVLILTKPLGTGMVAFAAQLGLVSQKVSEEVGHWMAALNKDAAELMLKHDAHACTDVTGFGLAGHLVSMVRGSGVTARIDLSALPVFGMVPECIQHEVFGGAVDRNQAYAMGWLQIPEDAPARDLPILFDPQTSGGLLIAIPPARGQAFLEEMRSRGHEAVAIIGNVVANAAGVAEGQVVVLKTELRTFIGTREPMDLTKARRAEGQAAKREIADAATCCDHPPELSCCDSPPGPNIGAVISSSNSDSSQVSARSCDFVAKTQEVPMTTLALFQDFMKEVNKPGRIDARNKKLMSVALSIAHRCHPCLKTHLQGAVAMGIPKEDLDEAAGLAIAFGGCTAMVFYKEVCQELGMQGI